MLRHPDEWTESSMHSIPIGYEVSATPLQIAMSYAAIANGGFLLKPKLILDEKNPIVIRQVVSSRTCIEIKEMMKLTIEKGTAIKAT